MPALAKSVHEKANEEAEKTMRVYLATRNLKRSDFGDLIGQSKNTGLKKLRSPELLTVSELRFLGLTKEEVLRIVLGGEEAWQ